MNQSLFDQNKLGILNLLLTNKIEVLQDELKIKLWRTNKLYYSNCHVHGGNNESALNIYPNGHTLPGYWRCNTHKCEHFFKKTMIGFIRGVLSHQKYDWTSPRSKFVFPYDKTIDYCCDLVGQKLQDIKITEDDIEKGNFYRQVSILNKDVVLPDKNKVTRNTLRKRLSFPAKYFIDRGWSAKILDKYDVGICKTPKKPMFNRAVVPVFDEDGKYIVGCTGRSLCDKCNRCELYHPDYIRCEDIKYKNSFPKWKNSDFDKELYLYNLWFAKEHIEKTKQIILVEGPGDVWKLEMAGIHNSVAMLGVSLSETQQIIIERTPATKIVVLPDNDEAGKICSEDIYERLKNLYELKFPEIGTYKDLGEMPIEEIRKILL